MNIETSLQNGVRVVAVQGEVDLESSPQLRDDLVRSFDGSPKHVVLYLKDVPYMDSSGVAVLLEGLQHSRFTKVRLCLAAPSAAVRDILSLARLDAYFDIHDTLEAAL